MVSEVESRGDNHHHHHPRLHEMQSSKELQLDNISNPDRSLGDKKRKRTTELNRPCSASSSSSSSSSAGSSSAGEYDHLYLHQPPPAARSIPSASASTSTSHHQIVHAVHGSISVSGRSREMEDALYIQSDLCRPVICNRTPLHYFAVFDGHGGSHVSTLCKERMHVFLREELMKESTASGLGDDERWRKAIHKSFDKMDDVALQTCACGCIGSNCGCDNVGLSSEIVGSTAVVALLTPNRIVVANCGDSRAVLSRGGVAVPLSFDHKVHGTYFLTCILPNLTFCLTRVCLVQPDRPDELARIEAAGGRVIYLNGARVLGILAMSRALGDKYLKPVVISKPDITFTNRTSDDECLILASDGLWDVLSNDMACDVARKCLFERSPSSSPKAIDNPNQTTQGNSDEQQSHSRCSVAAALLTRLALGRRSADNISVIVVDLKRC